MLTRPKRPPVTVIVGAPIASRVVVFLLLPQIHEWSARDRRMLGSGEGRQA